MRSRKLLSLLLAVIMIVASFSCAVYADGGEATYTTDSGVTITLPEQFPNVMWQGLTDDSPIVSLFGASSADEIIGMMESQNLELAALSSQETDGGRYEVRMKYCDAPAEITDEALQSAYVDDFRALYGVDISGSEVFDCSWQEINGVPYYTIHFEMSGQPSANGYAYIAVLNSGKLYSISFTDAAAGISDEDKAYDETLAETIINGVSFSSDFASGIVNADGTPLANYTPSASCSSNSENSGFEGTEYALASGITLKIPSNFTNCMLWDQVDDSASCLANMGCSTADQALSKLESLNCELMAYRDEDSQTTGYSILVVTNETPDDLSNESLFSAINSWMKEYSYASAPTYGYGVEEINGLSFFKMYAETPASKDYMYNYILVTDAGTMYNINFWNHGLESTDSYMDQLAFDVINSLTVSDELGSHIVALTGEPFTMIEGEHPGAFLNNDEAGSDTNNANENASAATPTPAPKAKTLYQKITEFEFPTYLILIALVIILFLGSRLSGKGEWQEEPFSLETSKAIQGFCAVAIIVHHLAQDLMADAGVLSFFSELGVLFVGVFFFFSGYGLFTSLKSKNNYLKGFLKKRLVTILIPFYVCILVFVVFACINGQKFGLKDALAVISGWILINSHMWYIVEIAVLYLVFFAVYKLIKNRAVATTVMGLFVVALTIGSLLLGHGVDMSSKFWFMGEWWYNTTLVFVLGIIVSQNSDKLRVFARRFYKLLLPVFAVLTVVFGFLTKYALNKWSYWYEYPGYPGYKEKFLCLSFQLPWVLFFVVTLLLIMMKVKFGNPVLKFLGSISLELYLIHNLFLTGFNKSNGSIARIPSNSLYIVLTILVSVGFATIISGLDKYIVGLINGKSKNTVPNLEKSSGRVHSIDVMRIVMAFLVVTIHIPFNGTAGNVFITYGKIAVPFFLAVCGYMLYREDGEKMMKRLIKQTVKVFFYYLGSNLLYGIALAISEYSANHNLNGFKATYFTGAKIKDLLLYNMTPFSEHLWFLGSLLYALIILMILNKLKVLKYAMYLAPALIATYVVLSHLGVAEGYVLRNALLVGLPYVMMGMLIRRYEDKLMKIKAPVLWILALVLCVTSVLELKWWHKGTSVPFISCEILVYVIILLCLKYPDFGRDTLAEKMGRDLSLPIYVLHILPMIFLPMKQGLMLTYGAITIFVITAFVSAIYVAIKHFIASRINRQKISVK